MAKRYIRLNWQNAPSVATPINAVNLNKMDKGIDDIDETLDALESSIVGQIVDDPAKINNAAVIYSLSNQVSAINNNLTYKRLTLTLADGVTINAVYSVSYQFGNIAIIHIRSITIPAGTPTNAILISFDLPRNFVDVIIHDYDIKFIQKGLYTNKAFSTATTFTDIHMVIPLT